MSKKKRKKRLKLRPHQRRELGLPEKGPLGLTKGEEADIRRLLQERGMEGVEKGKKAEKLFFEAWENLSLYPSWLISVRAASSHEDSNEKTDAVMTTSEGEGIRIQIKSSKRFFRRDYHDFYYRRIVLVQVFPDTDSLEEIREKTLLSIEQYREYVARKGHSS